MELGTGNQHRPDKGRLYYAWYYLLVDLPYWFRVSAQGWFDLCFVKASDCEDIVGGFGCLTDRLLSMINFPFVVDVPSPAPGFASESSRGSARESSRGSAPRARESSRGSAPRATYEFKFHSFMADMKALQQMLGLKPSGAYKCCGLCANILGRILPADVPPGGYMQHYSCGDTSLWDEWTHERFQDACAELARAFGESAERGQQLETQLGIYYNGGVGVAFGCNAALCRVPETMFLDAQHCIWASGGVAQFELNQLLCEAETRGVELAAVQEFLQLVVPAGGKRWTRDLAARVVRDDKAHMRAFASEMLLLTSIMVAFADAALEEVMPAHVATLRFLYTVQVMVFLGDGVLAHLRLLDEILAAHHDLFLALYGDCAKPKLHYMRHLAKLFHQFQKNINCFSAERHHKRSKQVAARCFKEMTTSLLRRSLWTFFQEFEKPLTFHSVRAVKPARLRYTAAHMSRHVLRDFGLRGFARSRELRTQGRTVVKGDFVLYKRGCDPPGVGGGLAWEAGVAIDFWTTQDGGNRDYYMVTQRHDFAREVTATTWEYKRSLAKAAVHHARILHCAPYFDVGDGVRVVLPLYARQLFS